MAAVFFDIDGTLLDFTNHIPESTKEAMRLLHENGHLTFICSGRTRGYIRYPGLFEMGFDGIVSGGGTMIEYNGEVLYYKQLEKDTAVRVVDAARRYGFRPILEGREYLYMDDEDFADDRYGRKLFSELGPYRKDIKSGYGEWEISKLSCATDGKDPEAFIREIEDDFEPIIHTINVVELVPKGSGKGAGIRKVCELLDLDINDTYAVGDSANDLDMFEAAGTAIAMGNGSDIAKEHADYITTAMADDGIYNAMKHFGLI